MSSEPFLTHDSKVVGVTQWPTNAVEFVSSTPGDPRTGGTALEVPHGPKHPQRKQLEDSLMAVPTRL